MPCLQQVSVRALGFVIGETKNSPNAPFDSKKQVSAFYLVPIQNKTQLGGHVRKHRKMEDNYKLLKEVSRQVPMDWYKKSSSC